MLKRNYNWLYALRLTDGAFSTSDQKLPWPRNSNDLRFFVETTNENIVVCSEGTFLSIVGTIDNTFSPKVERLLKSREWFVMWKDVPIIEIVPDVKDRFEYIEESSKQVFVIGGQRAFRSFNDPSHIIINFITSDPQLNARHNNAIPLTGWANYQHLRQRVLSDDVLSMILERKR